jgi:hypothetical protein
MPARRIWHPSPDTLVYPYDSIDETELVAKARRRSRRRIVLAVSVLAVSSAVYLACIYGDDLRVGAPVAATGSVSAQNGKPSVTAAGDSKAGGGQLRASGIAQGQPQHQQHLPADVAQRVASVPSSPATPVTPPSALTSGQHRVVSATTDAAQVTAAQPTSTKDNPRVDARPSGASQQQAAEVAQQPAAVRSSPVTPPAAPPPEQHRLASTTPDAARATAAPPVSAEEKVRATAQPSAVEQRLASVGPSTATPPAASSPEQHRIASATPDASRVTANQRIDAQDKPRADARPSTTAQQQPANVAQPVASIRPSAATPPAASSPEQRRVASATPDASRAATNQPISAQEKPRADTRPSATAQQQPAVVAQRLASVRPSAATPPAASPLEQRRIASATPDSTRAAAPQPLSAEDQRRAEADRYLRAAHANLRANNLSAAKSHIAAALAAQPDNRDAQRLRSTVRTLEQQRDALLSLARGCGYIEHLACTRHNARIALQIDSSSKEARRMAIRAERESELQIVPPADVAATQPVPVERYEHH